MSPEPNKIQATGTEAALKSAIMEEAEEEASQILTNAQAQAERIHQQAQAQVDAERETILQRAREQANALRSHAAAAAQLEAQTLKLKRREQLLERVFADARRKLASALQRPDYKQIAHHLVREAVNRLGADEALVQADEGTRRVLGDEALTNLGRELGVHLRVGEPLTGGSGVVLQTPDGHRRYDNTLETRLARMQDALRTPVYHILMGETPKPET